jgi:hypothetical protein
LLFGNVLFYLRLSGHVFVVSIQALAFYFYIFKLIRCEIPFDVPAGMEESAFEGLSHNVTMFQGGTGTARIKEMIEVPVVVPEGLIHRCIVFSLFN